MKRKIRMGMVGGGQGSFIGAVHRIAANLDGQIELVCGCFSSRPENSLATGQSLFLPDNRIYASYQEMIEKEATLPEGERMDFVSIVTPNHVHFGPAMMALEHGFHVVLDKPMTYTLDEAKQLRDKVKETGKLFMLTHTYTAYPMVKEARERVRRGDLGKIRRIYVNILKAGYIMTALMLISRRLGGWIPVGRARPVAWGISGRMRLIWRNI